MAETHKLTTTRELGIKICEALGLDPNRVSRIMIDLAIDCPIPYIEVIMIDEDDRLCGVDWSNLEQVQLSRK